MHSENTSKWRRKPLRHPPKKLPARRFFLFSWRWLLVAVLLTPAISYTVSVDIEVRKQFDGKRWALPARVYARALELYPEMQLSPDNLNYELEVLGYHLVNDSREAGDYMRKGNDFYINTRPFKFWDKEEPVRHLRVRFKEGDSIEHVADLVARQYLPLLRLDPMLIGKIYPTHKEDRILVNLEEVPPLLVSALMAIEDRNFYDHNGISLRSLGRATLENIKARSWVQGGSTLTQQLVKNHYLSPERTLKRKFNEALMALLLEWHYDKNEILEAYLNEVYLGQDGSHSIHGMGTAAWFYFNRPVSQLELPEVALLVALVRGASKYNPRKNPEESLKRRNLVLDMMLQQGMINAAEHKEAAVAPLKVSAEPPSSTSPYPAFLDLVRRQLIRDYREEDLHSEGLQIFTTLDPLHQRQAETSLVREVSQLERYNRHLRGRLEGAMIATSAETGEVLAIVGGKRTRYEGFNRALDAMRSIGSLVKPAIYLTALENSRSYSLLTTMRDKAFEWKNKQSKEVWTPQNYDGREHGNIPLIKALGFSYNLATVRLGFELGLDTIRQSLLRLGLEREFPVYPSMLLGGISLTPLEVTQMYQTIASGGFRVPLRAIRNVLDHNGEPLNRYPLLVEQRFDAASVFVLNHAMQQVIRSGTGQRVAKEMLPEDWRLAGKTGTTNDYRDSWFAGYGSDLLAVVWLGRDDNGPTGLTGGDGAMRIWGSFMKAMHPRSLSEQLPNRVEWRSVSASLGSLRGQGKVRVPVIVNHDREGRPDGNLAYAAQ